MTTVERPNTDWRSTVVMLDVLVALRGQEIPSIRPFEDNPVGRLVTRTGELFSWDFKGSQSASFFPWKINSYTVIARAVGSVPCARPCPFESPRERATLAHFHPLVWGRKPPCPIPLKIEY